MRPEFDRAWKKLEVPVREAVLATDPAAVAVTLIRFAIHLHMSGTQTHGTDQGKESFDDIVRNCYKRTIQDYRDSEKSSLADSD